MNDEEKTPFELYVEVVGRVASGAKLTEQDFSTEDWVFNGRVPYTALVRVAISLGAIDARAHRLRTQTEFDEKMTRLLEKPQP